METNNAKKDVLMVVAFIAFIGTAILTSGCSSSRGWRFEIGVSPVSNLENKAGLTEEYTNNQKNR